MKKILRVINSAEDIICVLFFCVMCIAVFLQVISREILKTPIIYTDEIGRYCYIWIAFISIPLGEKYMEHFSITAFTSFLKEKAVKILFIIECLIVSAIFIYLFSWSIRFWSFERTVKSPALELPMVYVSTSMCIGFGLAAIRRITHMVRAILDLFGETNQKEVAQA